MVFGKIHPPWNIAPESLGLENVGKPPSRCYVIFEKCSRKENKRNKKKKHEKIPDPQNGIRTCCSPKKSFEYQFRSICVVLSPFPVMVINDGLSPRFLLGGFNTVFAWWKMDNKILHVFNRFCWPHAVDLCICRDFLFIQHLAEFQKHRWRTGFPWRFLFWSTKQPIL